MNFHSENGIKECLKLRSFFQDKHIDLVYSSPLQRTLETAHIIFPNQEIIIELRLAPSCDSGSLIDELEGVSAALITHQTNIERIFPEEAVHTGSCFLIEKEGFQKLL
jgi:phosphohistidine phosphatase SixA